MTTTIDPTAQAGLVRREVRSSSRDGQETKLVVATRSYRADRADVWDALTNAERLPRWFAPVTGDLKQGGQYQVQDNASGTIERCDQPNQFALTWEFGGGLSWLQVSLADDGDRTRLELVHEAPVDSHWAQFGPGAVGVGWDLSLLGLGLHLETGEAPDHEELEAWTISENAKDFISLSSEGWADAAIGDGADPEQARAAAARTTAFFTGAEAPGE